MINLLSVPRNQGGVNWKILKTQELDKIRPLIVEVQFERQKLWMKLDFDLKKIKQVSKLGKLPRFLFRELMKYNL